MPYEIATSWGGFKDNIPTKKKALELARRASLDNHTKIYVYKTGEGKPIAVYLDERKVKNPQSKIEYGVVIHGQAALSQAGFKTRDAANRYLRALRAQGLLLGRYSEIIEIDNERMQ